MVKLIARKTQRAEHRLRRPEQISSLPCEARLKIMAMMIQPMVSSMIAVATMIWPTLRRMKFISRTTTATIFTEEIDSAVPRNSEATSRASGCGSRLSGRNSPSAKPQMKGTTMPATEIAIAALPTLRTSLRSVSMPVSSSSSRMPNCAMPSISAFCSGAGGKIACCASGHTQPNSEGPSMQAGQQFADHRGLADALHQLAEPAADGDQQHDLDQQQEFGRTRGLAAFSSERDRDRQ